MVGLFSENGPCWIDVNGDVQFNPYSWNNVSNMLWIDSPTQVGFSYSNAVDGWIDPNSGYLTQTNGTCPDYAPEGSCGTYSDGNYTLTANNTPAAAPNVWRTLQGFMGAFQNYSRNGVHFATESYGGHYGPVFATYFEDQNANLPEGATEIKLLSLSINNGWYSPILQYPAYYEYMVNNTYNFRPLNQTILDQFHDGMYGAGNCVDQLYACNNGGADLECSNTDDYCYDLEILYDTVTGRDEYDIRELLPDPYPYVNFPAYLNKPEVQQAIGAYVNFSYASTNLGAGTVANAFAATGDDSRELGIMSELQTLLNDKGIYMLHYAGDADYNCNWIGGEHVADNLNVTGWCEAGYQNISTPDGVVHGVVKQSGNYSFARIYQSGHYVQFYKPLAALTMFDRVIHNLDVATGTVNVVDNSYKSVGPARSLLINDNSTIQMQVTDPSQTYNTVTNVPNPCPGNCSDDDPSTKKMIRKRSAKPNKLLM